MGDEEAETNGPSGHPSSARRSGNWWGLFPPPLKSGSATWPRSGYRPDYLGLARCPRTRPDSPIISFHRSDFTLTEARAAFFDGREPYEVANPRGWYYLYPPLFALLVSPLAALDFKSQVVVWYIISLVLAFGCSSESRRLWILLVASDSVEADVGRNAAFRIGACAGLTVLYRHWNACNAVKSVSP